MHPDISSWCRNTCHHTQSEVGDRKLEWSLCFFWGYISFTGVLKFSLRKNKQTNKHTKKPPVFLSLLRLPWIPNMPYRTMTTLAENVLTPGWFHKSRNNGFIQHNSTWLKHWESNCPAWEALRRSLHHSLDIFLSAGAAQSVGNRASPRSRCWKRAA